MKESQGNASTQQRGYRYMSLSEWCRESSLKEYQKENVEGKVLYAKKK